MNENKFKFDYEILTRIASILKRQGDSQKGNCKLGINIYKTQSATN